MQLFNRCSLWRKAGVTLLLLATSTILYAAKPYDGERSASCAISTSASTITQGQTILFSSSTSGLKGGKQYQWEFESGDPQASTASSESVTYNTQGSFEVSLAVSSRKGNTSCTATVNVNASAANQPPTANANGPYNGTTNVAVSFSSAGSNDSDGTIASYAWTFGDGGSSTDANPSHSYAAPGNYSVSLTVTDNDGATGIDSTSATITNQGPPPEIPDVSINSTSQNGIPGTEAVPEQSFSGNSSHRIFATNDLGMHCGDFDTRISSILPPFNVLHAQVIRRGGEPDILTPANGVRVEYSAASNEFDPILTGINSAGSAVGSTDKNAYPVISSLAENGEVYKTNFWDAVLLGAYDPFYPPVVTPLAPFVTDDKGLPMPNVEQLWLGDGNLTAVQQLMPGILNPYTANNPQPFSLFTVDQPFFIQYPFGYVSPEVNWFEAAGIPLTAFDDFGRENPWPLYRVQAKTGSAETGFNVLASTDIVVPISGEANCGACHNAEVDGGNGSATEALGTNVATVLDDPEFDKSVPLEVSLEYAADLNLVRLHDQKHGTNLEGNTPVVCQSCHYTPALDLAQVGPKGPGDADANGRQQTNVRSMSNVMHSHHGGIRVVDNPDDSISVVESGGRKLFPDMAAAVDSNGDLRDPIAARDVLMETCYQCHPGRRTDCLRGAMANGGMLCQDCHGDMAQVGDDFSRGVDADNVGKFVVKSDFYTNAATPRVPWANEPGCGSCHTGDALDNMHGDSNTLGSPHDDIRLMQAFRTNDSKATPIVPANKRFAENVVTGGDAAGNPMLYRVSKGHEGVFCEACHGATHGIWPNKNPDANDNVTAMQLQGHTGTITECNTCHTGSFNIEEFRNSVEEGKDMPGPHGMHPVNDSNWNDEHKEVFERNKNTCRACHGANGRGTVLSKTAARRTLECKNGDGNWAGCNNSKYITVEAGTVIGCNNCHSMEN